MSSVYQRITQLLPSLSVEEQVRLKQWLIQNPNITMQDFIDVKEKQGICCPECGQVTTENEDISYILGQISHIHETYGNSWLKTALSSQPITNVGRCLCPFNFSSFHMKTKAGKKLTRVKSYIRYQCGECVKVCHIRSTPKPRS